MNVIADVYNSDESSMIRLNNDINTHINGGGNVSHILNININQSITDDTVNKIRQQVFHKINNIPLMFVVCNPYSTLPVPAPSLQVTITWRSNAVSNHYHADVMGIYGDVAVKLHTEMLLNSLSAYGGGAILDFIITKPLVRTIPI